MPTRRTLELVVITVIAIKPVFGLLHLWSKKTLDNPTASKVARGAAEVLTVIA